MRSSSPGDQIGQTGIEYQYDNVLRGRNGAIRIQVDASGEPKRQAAFERGAASRRQPAC